MNKKDIKKISLTFRTFANQVINAKYTEIGARLMQFVNYVDSTPLLQNYVTDCISSSTIENVQQKVEQVSNSYGHETFELGTTVEETTANTYRIMKYLSGKTDQILQLGLCMSHSSHFQDCAKAFGTEIVLLFAENLSLFLNSTMIDMGMDEESQYNITVTGGQVNISKDNSTINAVYNDNTPSQERLKELADVIRDIIYGNVNPNENAKKIAEALEGILEEMKRQSPKKGVVKMLLDGMTSASNMLTALPNLAIAVGRFVEYLQPFL